jgi:hypothetical protein
MSTFIQKTSASFEKYGIQCAPPRNISHMLPKTAKIKEAFPLDWYLDIEKRELLFGNSWRGHYLSRLDDKLSRSASQQKKRYQEWIDMHTFILQALKEYIEDTLGVHNFETEDILMDLWSFLPEDLFEGGVSGDLQYIASKRLLQKTDVSSRVRIDRFLEDVIKASKLEPRVTSPTAKRDTQRRETNERYLELPLHLQPNNAYLLNFLASIMQKTFLAVSLAS